MTPLPPRLALHLMVTVAIAAPLRAQSRVADWRLSPTPILSLGDNGAADTEFHRIAGAWRLPNGNVVVADGGSAELRIFNPGGALVETFGRRGKGPGEFGNMSVIEVAADTAIIYDRTVRRATMVHFGAKASVASAVTMLALGTSFNFDVVGRLSDGRWVTTAGMGTPGGWDAPKGPLRVKGTVGLVARDGGGTIEKVADVLSMTSITYMPGADKSKWVAGYAGFTPWYHGSTSAGVFWFGESGSDSLVQLDARGNRRRVVLPLPAVPVTPQLIAAAKAPELEAAQRRGRGDYEEFKYSAENLPARLPYYSSLLAGPSGELWVQEYAPVPTTPARYVVLDAQGRPIGRVAAPPNIRLTHAGRDFVVGITRDADGVEGVLVLRLERR